MQRVKFGLFILLILTALPLTGCGGSSDNAPSAVEPAYVETIDGSEFSQVVLTERAAERLGIQTVPVEEERVGNARQKVVPYSAVIYGLNGETWVYVNPEPLTFTRQTISIDFIEGDTAVLIDGPDVGTEVASVGVAELYGTDTGVGK